MKHLRVALITSTAVLALSTSAFAAGEHRLVLTSEAGDRESPVGRAMQSWASRIDELSEGRMRVDVF